MFYIDEDPGSVLVDDQPISSCNYLAFEANQKSVLTIEGLAQGGNLDPLQKAFIRNVGHNADIVRQDKSWPQRRYSCTTDHQLKTSFRVA